MWEAVSQQVLLISGWVGPGGGGGEEKEFQLRTVYRTVCLTVEWLDGCDRWSSIGSGISARNRISNIVSCDHWSPTGVSSQTSKRRQSSHHGDRADLLWKLSCVLPADIFFALSCQCHECTACVMCLNFLWNMYRACGVLFEIRQWNMLKIKQHAHAVISNFVAGFNACITLPLCRKEYAVFVQYVWFRST